jgi:hypothetical protein
MSISNMSTYLSRGFTATFLISARADTEGSLSKPPSDVMHLSVVVTTFVVASGLDFCRRLRDPIFFNIRARYYKTWNLKALDNLKPSTF